LPVYVHWPEKWLIACGLGKIYQIEQDDRRVPRATLSLYSPMSASGAIDLGELSDNPRDEEVKTGIFFYASNVFYHFPPPTTESVALPSISPRLYREAGVSLIHLGLCSPCISIGQRTRIRRWPIVGKQMPMEYIVSSHISCLFSRQLGICRPVCFQLWLRRLLESPSRSAFYLANIY
jgi:hypothetical protein